MMIKWLVRVLWRTKSGHDEMVRLRAQEMGAKRSEAKRQAARARLSLKPNSAFGSSNGV